MYLHSLFPPPVVEIGEVLHVCNLLEVVREADQLAVSVTVEMRLPERTNLKVGFISLGRHTTYYDDLCNVEF